MHYAYNTICVDNTKIYWKKNNLCLTIHFALIALCGDFGCYVNLPIVIILK